MEPPDGLTRNPGSWPSRGFLFLLPANGFAPPPRLPLDDSHALHPYEAIDHVSQLLHAHPQHIQFLEEREGGSQATTARRCSRLLQRKHPAPALTRNGTRRVSP